MGILIFGPRVEGQVEFFYRALAGAFHFLEVLRDDEAPVLLVVGSLVAEVLVVVAVGLEI